MKFVFVFVCCFCFEFQFVFLFFWLRQKANEMCWNTRLFSMAKLLPRSVHLIRYGITYRPSVCLSVSLSVCLSIHSSSTSNFLIAAKTSNAARPTSFWPARQDLPLNLDASQVFYNLQCYICIHKVHTHTHMCVYSYSLHLPRAVVGHRLTRSTFCSPDLWAAFGPRFVLATAEGQRKSSAQFITAD